MINQNEKMFYSENWFVLLKELIKWSPSDYLNWLTASGILSTLDHEDELTYHVSPAYWIVPVVLDYACPERLSDVSFAECRSLVLEALDGGWIDYSAPDINWDRYRGRVNEAIAAYGGRLPAPSVFISADVTHIVYRKFNVVTSTPSRSYGLQYA